MFQRIHMFKLLIILMTQLIRISQWTDCRNFKEISIANEWKILWEWNFRQTKYPNTKEIF